MRLLSSIVIVVVLLSLALPAAASASRIRHITAAGAATVITGTWPSACQPVVSRSSRLPTGSVDILLADPDATCPARPHPFRIQVPFGAQFSPALTGLTPVRVFAASREADAALVGFALLGGHDQSVAPDSGFWWPQGQDDASGNVLSLERQGDTLVIALLSHDDLSGAPTWYFGAARIEGSTAHAELVRLEDGASPFFGMQVQPVPSAGVTIDIAFANSTRAKVWMTRPDPVHPDQLQLASIEFVRRSFLSDPPRRRWQGHWLVARDIPADGDINPALPRRLDLTLARSAIPGALSLVDAASGAVLDCRYRGAAPTRLQQCSLRTAAGAALARFDQVGLKRMRGEDRQGHTVILLRTR